MRLADLGGLSALRFVASRARLAWAGKPKIPATVEIGKDVDLVMA